MPNRFRTRVPVGAKPHRPREEWRGVKLKSFAREGKAAPSPKKAPGEKLPPAT